MNARECVVLTFVCPGGSPHTHWSAALRLIGHWDKKYTATTRYLFPTLFITALVVFCMLVSHLVRWLADVTDVTLVGDDTWR